MKIFLRSSSFSPFFPFFPFSLLLPLLLLLLLVLSPQVFANDLLLDENLQWGPFRPKHYFGIRPTIPNTMLMGLMWSNATFDVNRLDSQMRDQFDTTQGDFPYGWLSYDPRVGGTQLFQDYANGLNITTQFIKFPYAGKGGGHWGARVSGTPGGNTRQKTVVVWHLAMENMGQANGKDLACGTQYGRMVCSGQHPSLGKFHMKISPLDGNRLAEKPKVYSDDVSGVDIWKAKPIYIDKLNTTWTPKDPDTLKEYTVEDAGDGNMHFLQLVFVGAFSFDIMYTSTSYQIPMNTSLITAGIITNRPVFESNFQEVFPISPPFTDTEHAPFGRFLLSNLLAGIGFYHGSLASGTTDEEPLNPAIVENSEERSLLTHTPSRKYLAEGFLWHEGFHLLVMQEWDLDLAIDVLRSWLGTMDDNGWIASRQILGSEVESRFSGEDRVQEIDIASPPSLLALALPKILLKLQGEENYRGHYSKHVLAGRKALRGLYPQLRKHYLWFRDNQQGDMANYGGDGLDPQVQGYRWRGCEDGACPASGFEDYPRPEPEIEEDALHVDALAWMGASATAMADVANFTGFPEDMANFTRDIESVWKTLGEIHWDEEEGVWCDTTSNSSSWRRDCHVGYVSLMPLFLGLVDPTSGRLGRVMDVLSDNGTLWSEWGIRSLSRKDGVYAIGSKTWRGRIWMNFNVLASLRLKELSETPGKEHKRAAKLALDLRGKAISTVYTRWRDGGRQEVWESYSDRNGVGGSVDGFTGWTSCVLLLMGMVRDEAGLVEESADEAAADDEAAAEAAEAADGVDGNGSGFQLSYFLLALGLATVLFISRRRIRALYRWAWGHDKRNREWVGGVVVPPPGGGVGGDIAANGLFDDGGGHTMMTTATTTTTTAATARRGFQGGGGGGDGDGDGDGSDGFWVR